ncbi:MAG TPA: beta-N-acetylhexosaminidase [Pilimelia sp.]|nr:beta-N-acetylhexosaminidase [Pilimelia sp.]
MSDPYRSLLPRPGRARPGAGGFRLAPDTTLAAGPDLAAVAGWLRGVLGPATGCWLPPADPGGPAGVVLAVDPALPPEGYRLVVAPGGVRLHGGDPAGVRHGAETLRQLLPPAAYRRAAVAAGPWTLPAGVVDDAPAFRWRGCLLDVARHFLPVADVLRFVDLLAAHKLNVLHLHLTDDQGWRLPVPGYPRLTEVGGWRAQSMLGSRQHGRYDGRPHGGHYTAEDLREIVAYAAARQVTVVPEVDLPGHAQAAIAAYPRLGNGARPAVATGWGISPHVLNVDDATLDFCRAVLDEVCALFPGRYVGIGGDECQPDEWRESPAARARAAALGLADAAALGGWFVRQLADHLRARGRRAYAWDDVLADGAPDDVLVAAWRGPAVTAAAARAGHAVVACPDTSTYLDYRQSEDPGEPTPVGTLLTLADVYAFDPVPPGLAPAAAARVLGGQCNVWTEHIDGPRALDYQAFPRLCAFAEAVWTSGPRDVAEFAARLPAHLARLDALGVEYRRPSGPQPWQTRPDAPGWPRSRTDREAELSRLTAAITGADGAGPAGA